MVNSLLLEAAKLLLRSCDVKSGRKYDKENSTSSHYDRRLKVSVRGVGKKRLSQIDLLNKSGVVLAPSDLWEAELPARLATLLSNPPMFSTESTYKYQGGVRSIKAALSSPHCSILKQCRRETAVAGCHNCSPVSLLQLQERMAANLPDTLPECCCGTSKQPVMLPTHYPGACI